MPGPGSLAREITTAGTRALTSSPEPHSNPVLRRGLLTWQGEAEHPSRSMAAFKEKELPVWQREEGKPAGPQPLPPWRGV